jgi:ankyrin repeat protein
VGGTLLMDAAMRNPHTDVLDVIVQSGVEVNAVDNFGHTALIDAVKYNSETDALERLVDLGADVNVKSKAGLQPLGLFVIPSSTIRVVR